MEDLGIDEKYTAPRQVRRLGEVAGNYTYFAEGDVLLAKITPCFQNGKISIARGLKNGVGFGSSEFIVLRPKTALDPEYLYYFLSRDDFRQEGVARMGGSVGQQRVPPEYVLEQSVPLPSLPEQRRIVEILDKAFAAIAVARVNTEKNIENARAVFDSRVHSLFSEHSTGWPVRTIDGLAHNLDSRRVPITKGARVAGEYPYYGASGVVDYVADYIFEGDALLVSEDGANLLARSTPIAFPASGKFWVNNHAHVLKFQDLATQRLVELYLESIKIDQYVTGTAQPKLTQKALHAIPIPVPASAEETSDVIASLDALQDQARALGLVQQRKLAALDVLKKSLLHHAFAGQLTSRVAERALLNGHT